MASEEQAAYTPVPQHERASGRTIGSIEISSEVIAAIAAQAARKIDGITVVESSFKLSEIFGSKETVNRGVAVRTDEESGHVNINVDVNVTYGITIYDAVTDLQLLIKEEVESLTGSMNVDRVNVRVKQLIMPPEEEKEKKEVLTPDQVVAEEIINGDDEEELN